MMNVLVTHERRVSWCGHGGSMSPQQLTAARGLLPVTRHALRRSQAFHGALHQRQPRHPARNGRGRGLMVLCPSKETPFIGRNYREEERSQGEWGEKLHPGMQRILVCSHTPLRALELGSNQFQPNMRLVQGLFT
jgi:hypothetical protein